MQVIKKIVHCLLFSLVIISPRLSPADIQFQTTPFSSFDGSASVYDNVNFRFTAGRNPYTFHFSGKSDQQWGEDREGQSAILDFAYFSFRAEKLKSAFKLGRFRVNEGISAAWIDGALSRFNVTNGMTLSVFAGSHVDSGGTKIVGGRFSHAVPNRYGSGISYFREPSGYERFKEEAALDVWFRPYKMLALSGKSRFNLRTDTWIEQSCSARLGPFHKLTLLADAALFYSSPVVPGLAQSGLSSGGGVEYMVTQNLSAEIDARKSDGAGTGGVFSQSIRLSYNRKSRWGAGVSVVRREFTDHYRVDAGFHITQKNEKTEAFLSFRKSLYEELAGQTSAAVLNIAYQLRPAYRLAADFQKIENSFSRDDIRAFLKLEYRFST